jgi:hypothetical protein
MSSSSDDYTVTDPKMLAYSIEQAKLGFATDIGCFIEKPAPQEPWRDRFARRPQPAPKPQGTIMTIAYDSGSRAVRQMQDFRRAEQECAGVVRDTLAMDSAAEVYGAALTALGVETADLAAAGAPALRAAFLARRAGRRSVLATDSGSREERAERFPNANRLG